MATALSIIVGAAPMMADDNVRIEHLGVNNTLVRVDGNGKYLLMPVQESNDDAKVDILVDGKLDRTINVRLAKTRVDYKVPFDLQKYDGHNVVLNIVTQQNRSSVRDAKEDVCWKNFETSDTFDTTNREKYRPAYHHTPLYGWMNDPNGMFYKDGVWHLCYQWNPYGSKWQNMTWGQSTSRDLIHWDHKDALIEPDGLGTIFSGSAVVDHNNSAGFGDDAVVFMYTSAGESQIQSLAWSTDNGETATMYPGNPVLTMDSEARDPNMFWNEEKGEWVLLLAHALDHEMLIFTSPDMKTWTLQSSFGKGHGAQNGVWECPDMIELPVRGTNTTKWVLICNINPGGPFGGSATQYFVGDFDGKTFVADTPTSGKVPTKWMDYGKDHYATVSWSGAPDNRKVVIGWMSNWQYATEVPTMQFRSANTLPRDLSLFKGDDGEYYLSTIPSPETDVLRGKLATSVKSTMLSPKGHSFNLPGENDGICEIAVSVNAMKASGVALTLSNAIGDKVKMVFDPKSGEFSVDRTNSGITIFSQDFPAIVTAPTLRKSTEQSLRIFIDRSSIEVFDKDGNFVITNLVFPNKPYTTLTVEPVGDKARLNYLDIYSINLD